MATQPRTISQRIALVGAEEIARKLEQLGVSYENALKGGNKEVETSVRNLENLVRVVGNVERAFAGISTAGRAFGGSIATLGAAFNAFEAATTRAVRNLALLAGGGGLVGAAGAGILKFATGAVQATDALQENAAAAGLSAEAYQRLQAATESSGLKQAQFGQVMARLNDQFLDAQKAQNEFARAASDGIPRTDEQVKKLVESATNAKNIFTRLGVDLRNLRPDQLEEAIRRVGERLRQLPSDVQRVQAGVDTLGARVGGRAAQALADLRNTLQETKRDLDAIRPPAALEQAGQNASRAFDRLASVAGEARRNLGLIFAPALTQAADGFRQAIVRNFRSLQDFARSIETNVASVVRDLIRLLNGDEARIENRWILSARDAVVAFGQSVRTVFTSVVLPAINLVKAGLEGLATAINATFGTRLTASDVGIILVLGKITGAFGLVVAAAGLATAAVNVFFNAFRVLGSVALGLATLTGGWPLIAGAAVAAAALILTNWTKVKDFFAGFGVDLQSVENAYRRLGEVTGTDVLGGIAENFKRGSEALADFQQKAENLGGFWPQLGNVLRSIDPDLDRILTAVENGIARLEALIERVRNFGGKGTAAAEAFKTDAERDADNAAVQAAEDAERARSRLQLSREEQVARARQGAIAATTALTDAERTLTQTVNQNTQARTQNAQAAARAAQVQTQATQAAAQAAQAETAAIEAARDRVQIKQAEQAATRNAAREAAALVPDLAEVAKFSGRDLSTPMKTLGDEIGKTQQKAKTLPPIFVDVEQGVQRVGQQAETGLVPIVENAQEAAAAVPKIGEGATQAGQEIVRGLAPVVDQIRQVEQAIQQIGQTQTGVGSLGAGPFTSLIEAARSAVAQILALFQGLGGQIASAVSGGGPALAVGASEAARDAAAAVGATGPFAGLISGAQAAAAQILSIFQTLGSQIGAAISGTGAAVAAVAAAPAQAAGAAVAAPAAAAAGVGPFQGLVASAQAVVPQILQVFSALGQQIANAIATGLQGLGPALSSAFSLLPSVFQGAISQIEQAAQAMVASVERSAQEAIRALQEVVRAAQEAAAEAALLGAGFARGGYTGGGPRTKVAGVVHAGEYVQPARVVRQPGVLGFMEALRQTGDLHGVIERFTRGFSMGGLVPTMKAPQFSYASGGLAVTPRSLGTLTLATSSGQSIATVFTDRMNAEALGRFASAASRRSGGRKPSRYS